MSKTPFISFFFSVVLLGCASQSADISASYVSPIKYNSYSCSQMEQEYARLISRSDSVNKRQNDIAGNDAVAMGVGLVLFWPALFFIDNDDHREEVARLKGELESVEDASVQKNCSSLANQIAVDRKRAAELEKKRKEELRKIQQD
jgi:hypothetical protein